jgi:hypothetical protein
MQAFLCVVARELGKEWSSNTIQSSAFQNVAPFTPIKIMKRFGENKDERFLWNTSWLLPSCTEIRLHILCCENLMSINMVEMENLYSANVTFCPNYLYACVHQERCIHFKILGSILTEYSCSWRLICLTRSILRNSDLRQRTVIPVLKVVTTDRCWTHCVVFGVHCAHALCLIAEIWSHSEMKLNYVFLLISFTIETL